MKFSTLIVFTLSSILAPFVIAQAATAPTSGLLITHVNSQQWQIRLISGTDQQRFSGVMESDNPITNVQGYALESGDVAQLLTPNSLGATFATWPGGTDGVDFTVGAGAKLCLRDTGSSGVQMYLGDSLVDAIPVTAPVALTSSDACGATTGPPPPGNRKFHPGHYIALGRSASSQAIMAQSIKPGVVGFLKRYTWRSLEPSQGVYQFSVIKSDLAWAAANSSCF